MAADEPGRAAQRGDRLLALAISAEDRNVDPRRAQVGKHFDTGDGPEAEPRIVDFGADDVDHLLAEELAHLLRAPGHGGPPTSRGVVESRSRGEKSFFSPPRLLAFSTRPELPLRGGRT